MKAVSAWMARLFGKPDPESRVVNRTIEMLHKSDDELERRLAALRAQVDARAGGDQGRRSRD